MRNDGSLDGEATVTAWLDGQTQEVAPGGVVLLQPGESVTLFPGTHHAFWGEGGDAALGEVSTVNDDQTQEVAPGGVVLLQPGESVTLFPGTHHAFWGEGGDAALGEVSTVNDDQTDNDFPEPLARFSAIEEDQQPHRLPVSDYAALRQRGAPAEDQGAALDPQRASAL